MSLKTGRYPYDIECWDNNPDLASGIPTFAHALGIAGYEVVLDGRAHFRGGDQRHGFQDRLVGDESGSYWGQMNDRWVEVNGTTYLTGIEGFYRPAITAFSGPGGSQYQEYDKVVLEAALNFIRDRSSQTNRRPFCLVVGFESPHYWFTCPPELFAKYEGKVEAPPLPDNHPDSLHPINKEILKNGDVVSIPPDDVKRTRAAYYGLVEFTDWMVGQLNTALEDGGLKDETLVLYLTDHGEMAGEHGMWWKNCFYEGASRVPLLVTLPNKFPAKKRVHELVSLIDLFPSLCDWTGAPYPPGLMGQSLDPFIHGKAMDQERVVYSELYSGFPGVRTIARMARQGPWKYNFYDGEPSELFNLVDDPHEFDNLAEKRTYRDVCNKMKKLVLQNWDPDKISIKLQEHRDRMDYLGEWGKMVSPPDPDEWDGMKRSFPNKWKENALAISEYARLLKDG